MMAELPTAAGPPGGRFGRWIGAGLLVHFAAVCTIIAARRDPGEVLWLSHVVLLLAGVGLVLQSTLLVTTALATAGVLHGLWLVDSLSGLILGWFPLGGTTYLLTTDRWTWIATGHHFYLVPLLLVIFWRHGACPKATLPAASILFLLLTLGARIAASPAANVNYTFRVAAAPDHPLVVWANGLSPIPYLLVVNIFVTGVMFLPVVLLMRYRARNFVRASRFSEDLGPRQRAMSDNTGHCANPDASQ